MQELIFPRIMMVSDEPITKDNPGQQRIVWAYNDKFHYPYFAYFSNIKTLKDIDKIPPGGDPGGGRGGYKYAQDYIESIIELTLQNIADKFNVDVDTLHIED